jgi:glucose-fructose oxidoreductase
MGTFLRSGLRLALAVMAIGVGSVSAQAPLAPDVPVRVAIVGLVHNHVAGFLGPLAKNPNAKLVAIVEAREDLKKHYQDRFHLDPALFYSDLEKMLVEKHPDAVLVYTSIHDHRKVIEAAARHGISSMVEKPLATTMEDSLAIRKAAREHHVYVLTNYETTWYASNAEAIKEVEDGKLGVVRKVVVHDGHEGPKEIGVGPEFLSWLTDPVENGAGAMFDFGCYGADLVTVMMHGQAPESVTAVAQTDKPDIYPKVDDDATIILRYKGAQAVLMPSWDWSFGRKDMEVYGTQGALTTVLGDKVRVRYHGEKADAVVAAPPLPADRLDSLDYLAAVMRGQIKPDGDLTALDTNMVVMQILTAARESAKTGKTVELKGLPQ